MLETPPKHFESPLQNMPQTKILGCTPVIEYFIWRLVGGGWRGSKGKREEGRVGKVAVKVKLLSTFVSDSHLMLPAL